MSITPSHRTPLFLILLLAIMLGSHGHSRTIPDFSLTEVRKQTDRTVAAPAYCAADHSVGRFQFTITNYGVFGSGYSKNSVDCFTGLGLKSGEYPKGQSKRYVYGGAVWIGGIVGRDTLVSTGHDAWLPNFDELRPDEPPWGGLRYYSTLDTAAPSSQIDAISHQDFEGVYTDTYWSYTPDPVDGRPHRPLGMEVRQRSFTWGYPQSEDFVLVELKLRNIGSRTVDRSYLGMLLDADIGRVSVSSKARDDLTGFRDRQNIILGGCPIEIDVPTGWMVDNDGDAPVHPSYYGVPDIIGLSLLSTTLSAPIISYNWWASNGNPALDIGPQGRATFRSFGTGGTGTPNGDRNKYHVLSNGEIDYDQAFTFVIGQANPNWIYPGPTSSIVASGQDTRFLVSVGPVDMHPGQSETYYFAFVMGERFHQLAGNNANLPQDPATYYANVSFEDLDRNVLLSLWHLDQPGVDTDGDGYFGPSVMCGKDTIFYKGDGLPDLRSRGDVTAWNFTRHSPRANTIIPGGAITFAWSRCQTIHPIDEYEVVIRIKDGDERVFSGLTDTTFVLDLNPSGNVSTPPIELDWYVRARSGAWSYLSRDGEGSFTYGVPIDARGLDAAKLAAVPTEFSLEQNYPNPFNPSTEITFALPRAEHVTVEIFNVAGQRVATLLDASFPAGEHAVTWNGRDRNGSEAASGVYFYRIEAGEYVATKKMMLVR